MKKYEPQLFLQARFCQPKHFIIRTHLGKRRVKEYVVIIVIIVLICVSEHPVFHLFYILLICYLIGIGFFEFLASKNKIIVALRICQTIII